MNTGKVCLLTGYRASELGIFSNNDPKIAVIKKALRRRLINLVENGVEWVLTSGNLGVETWGAQVVLELKEEYEELHLGIIFPFADFGNNWNDTNRMQLESLKQQADFVTATSTKPYENPSQLRNHQDFLLQKTQLALVVYDAEFEGKPKWIKQAIEKEQEKREYEYFQIDMFELEEAQQEF